MMNKDDGDDSQWCVVVVVFHFHHHTIVAFKMAVPKKLGFPYLMCSWW